MLCNNANAAIYCYNDNAYLCKACDGQIHNKNKLAWRHQRSYLCEVCDSVPPKPAVVYCAQDKVRARARISTPEPSRWRCAAAFPRFHDDGKTEDHPRPSTFRASVVGVVGRRLRRGATVDTRATHDALFRETRAPRLASRDERADRSALPAASPPRASAVRRRVSRVYTTRTSLARPVFQKKNTRRTCACRAAATCTPRTASRARTSARP